MTDYISLSHWGLFPVQEKEHRSRCTDEPEVLRAKIKKFQQGYYTAPVRGVILDLKS